MTIRIVRNEAGNCINFEGSSNPVYFNACLSGQVDPDVPNVVNVINDIQSVATAETKYEFYQIPFEEFADRDGNSFNSAQEAADYITAQGNVIGTSDVGSDLTGIPVDFRLDETSTSIIMDNGSAFGVNTIKAVPDTDGTIHIHAIGDGQPNGSGEADDRKHFQHLEHTRVSINGVSVSGGLSDVCNALNELFTVGAFTSVIISDPFSTMVADVSGTATTYSIVGTNGIDPAGDDVFGADSTGSRNGLKTVETIDQPGEYFTFDIRNEGQIGFGLIISDQNYTDGVYKSGSNASYIDPSSFGVGNSAHFGFQWSHWFHPTPNGSWTQYGASTGYVMGPAWYSANTEFEGRDEWLAGDPIKIKVGIDENGYISVSSLKDDGATWVLHARSNYPVVQGSEFHLGIKMGSTAPRVYTAPKVHLLEPAAPTMNFRYIESPDGYYSFPLFATQEEADYYEEQVSGSANGSHTHTYPDDPSNTTWYMPATSNQMNYGLTPVEDGVTTFMSNPIVWTEITSLTNADLTPPSFTAADLTVDENSSVNYQTQPQDTAYTTAISGLPFGLMHIGGGVIVGTAPEVTGDNVANPSDSYTITVTRTNSYGSSQGTFDIIVNNLTAPVVTPITGFDFVGGTALVDSDTMAGGSVVSVTETIGDGERIVIDREWADAAVQAVSADSGTKRIWIGFKDAASDFSTGATRTGFDLMYEFYNDGANRANNNWRLRVMEGSTQLANVGVGSLTNALYDYVFVNDGGVVKIGGLVASQGHDASTYVYDTSDPNWQRAFTHDTGVTGAKTLYIATENTQFDLTTTGIDEYDYPYSSTDVRVSETSETDARFDVGNGPVTADNITLAAGTTYRFYLNNASIESGDTLTFETADGTTYTTGVTTVGTHGEHNYYVQFAVPTDVPPLHAVWNGTDLPSINISGSTYTAPITGLALEGSSSGQTGSNLFDAGVHGWASVTETLSAGERLILDNAFLVDLVDAMPANSLVSFGLKDTDWNNGSDFNDGFVGGARFTIVKNTGATPVVCYSYKSHNGVTVQSSVHYMTVDQVASQNLEAFLELTSTGNNVRSGYRRDYVTTSAEGVTTTPYGDWPSTRKSQTGDEGFGLTSAEIVIQARSTDSSSGPMLSTDVDWTGLSEINIPQPAPSRLTNWTKALDFSGSAEYAYQVTTSTYSTPLNMGTVTQTVNPNADLTKTASSTAARPWATAIVFKSDRHNSNQHIWNFGEGASSGMDNIYLRQAANGDVYFGWGRESYGLNEVYITTVNSSDWYGIYVGHKGQRFNAANATGTNLSNAFDIRVMTTEGGDNFNTVYTLGSLPGNWTSTGFRMDRGYAGRMVIGGRYNNRSWHGKVASMVSTALRVDYAMPDDTEVKLMITDPKKWEDDYRVGQLVRNAHSYTNSTYAEHTVVSSGYGNTQIWLMGDGSSDSFANGMRNDVAPNDQNYTKMQLNSMVSNDIQNVTINGLS